MALAMKAPSPAVQAFFDEDADVLYVTYGERRPGYGDEGEQDIILRFADDNTPIGATVIGFNELQWPKKTGEFAKIVGRHLGVSPIQVLVALGRIGMTAK